MISSTILAIQLPYALIPLIKFTASERIMGPMAVSAKRLRYTIWLSGGIIGANVILILTAVVESELVCGSLAGVRS